MNYSASAPWCTHADATSGRNELMQYFKLLESDFKPNATTASATALCHYNVSEPRVDAGAAGRNGCVRFHIQQRCPLHAPLGGASFRVESLGAHLVLCSQLSVNQTNKHTDRLSILAASLVFDSQHRAIIQGVGFTDPHSPPDHRIGYGSKDKRGGKRLQYLAF